MFLLQPVSRKGGFTSPISKGKLGIRKETESDSKRKGNPDRGARCDARIHKDLLDTLEAAKRHAQHLSLDIETIFEFIGDGKSPVALPIAFTLTRSQQSIF